MQQPKFNPNVVAVMFESAQLSLGMADGRKIYVPLEWFPRLRDASDEQRAHWRFIGRGQGIHWPDIDEDILVEGLLRLV